MKLFETNAKIACTCLGVTLAVAAGAAMAQARTQPIRVIIPATPGGLLDGSVRRLAPRMGELLGQPVIVENRAGANGLIGMAEVARSAPDGQTLMYYNESVALIPHVVKNPGLDSLRDFTPITQTLSATFGLFVHPSVPAGTLKEFVAYTKANPGKVNGSSGGAQTASGLFFEAFKQASGADMQHIPYKSAGQVVTDFLAGQLQVFAISTTLMAPHVRSGKVKALAVAKAQRVAQLPDVPTFAEAGYPMAEYSTWLGFFGPAKLPAATTQRLYEAATKALNEPATHKGFVDQGLDVYGTTPAEFAKLVLAENAKFGKAAAAANIQPE
jgi:tripartite-type tricarboxylate transporter receptor subunit TctC